jgi:uncharacterized protein YndB with AHSA1/START domain
MTDIVRAALYIQAPLETVWQTLTRPDLQGIWYVSPGLMFGWEQGDRVAWGTAELPVIEGNLLQWEPASRFSHTFRFTRFDEPSSRVEWELMPLGEVVWVEVQHFFPEEALETQALITDGWVTVLSRLKTYLETGTVMPWPEWEEPIEA